MSQKYIGGFITKSPTAPTTAAAKGIWTLDQAADFVKQGIWPRSPGAPTIGTATQTSATTATVTYTAPSDLGTGSVTFTATSTPDSITGTGASPITVSGLTTNTSYTFKVTAATPGGTGPASAASNSVTPTATVPGAPTIGTATATGSTTATVSYTAPASNGGSVITSYTATSSPSGGTGTLSQAGSGTITVTGLTGGTAYTFTVTATNAIGTSAASAASNSITTPLVIGQAFGGGFFAGQIGVSGVATHNLVVGPLSSAQNASKQWKTANTGGDPTSVIDGPANSATMNSATYPAAQFCEGLTIGGFSDWYMPAQNELEVCYYNLKPTTTNNNTSSGINANAVPARASTYTNSGGVGLNPAQTSVAAFQTGGAEAFTANDYWASNEASSSAGFKQSFSSGNQTSGGGIKTSSEIVRAVRRIPV